MRPARAIRQRLQWLAHEGCWRPPASERVLFLKTFPVLAAGLIVTGVLLAACNNKQDILKKKYIAEGMVLYRSQCQNCHQIDGTGFEKLIPPLTDTLYLRRHRNQLACFIRYGMTDPVTIHGQVYDQPMIANERLTEMEIAEILTYITNAFGNSQDMFTIQEVRRALARCQPADTAARVH